MTLEKTSIGQLMSIRLETIKMSSSAQVASKKMKDKNISSLVVTDNYNKPVGIVTERDLVRKICVNDTSSSNTQIKDVMSLPLLTIDATASVGETANMMIQNRVRHILIIESEDINKPLGIVTPSDFVGYLKENLDIDDINAKILESLKEQREGEQTIEELEQQKELPKETERGGVEYENETPRQA
jgi:signal-transduction protein with cAMP-binding, CBS, and nucleotidyltransferase domain